MSRSASTAVVVVGALGVLAGLAVYQISRPKDDLHGIALADVSDDILNIKWGDGLVARKDITDDMVLIEAGVYVSGDESADAMKSAPAREVELDAFYIDAHEVTNRQFKEFVDATGYVTYP